MEYEKIKKGWEKRRLKIVKLHDEGMGWADIGRRFCISRQRAQQIYNAELEKGNG